MEKKETGIVIDERTFGSVVETVWCNPSRDGTKRFKVELRRLYERPNGEVRFGKTFLPEDLCDLDAAVIRAATVLDGLVPNVRKPDITAKANGVGPIR